MTTHALFLAAWLSSLAAPLGGQSLSGTWHCRSPLGEETTLRIRQDSSGVATGTVLHADRLMALHGVVDGILLQATIEDGAATAHVTARLLGTSLLWREGAETEEHVCQRADVSPTGRIDSIASDSFSGTWVAEGVRLVLAESGGSYTGTLTVAGTTWSVLARASGTVLLCTIATEGRTGRLTATLSGRSLLLSGRAASATLERILPDSGGSR